MWETVFDNLRWVFSGIGIAVVAALVAVFRRMRIRFGKPKHKLAKYAGWYETYHFNSRKRDKVIRSYAEIRATRFGLLSIFIESFGYQYEGAVTFKGQNMFLTCHGKGHDELMLHVLNEPLTSEFDVLVGVFAAITETFVPGAGKILYRRTTVKGQCAAIPVDQCEEAIVGFLKKDATSPIVVSRLDRPLFRELSEQIGNQAEQIDGEGLGSAGAPPSPSS